MVYKQKSYCKKCRFYRFGARKIPDPTRSYEPACVHTAYCVEPHKIFVDSPIDRIDESDNCFVKNKDNCCIYFKPKKKGEQ